MLSRRTGFSLSKPAVLLALFAAPFVTGSHVQAQIRVMSSITTDDSSGGTSEGAISKRSVDQYAAILHLSDEQKDAAMTLHEGYLAAFRRAGQERAAAMRDLFQNADEEDRGALMEEMPRIQKKWKDATDKLNKGFLADVKSLLTPDQESVWPKVERARRREVGLRGGQLSGSSVDLVDVLRTIKPETLHLDESARAALAEAIEQYEADLDRQIAEKDRILATIEPWEPGRGIDLDTMQEQMKKSREAFALVRDVNEKSARKLEHLIPEPQRAQFASEVKRRSFPRVYRTSRVSKAIEAALKLDDVDSDQKKQIAGLKEAYEKELGTVNDAWAAAIRENDDKEGGGLVGMGGAQVRLSFGDDSGDKGPLADARKARRDLDARMKDRLDSLLTPAQRERLPKQSERGDDAEENWNVGGDSGVVIRRGG